MTRSHSRLSPSGASRWMECTPSAAFEDQFEQEKSSIYADEGTFAHHVSEILLKNYFQKLPKHTFQDELKKAKKHKFFSAELYNYCLDYMNIVIMHYQTLIGQKHISFEIVLDLTEYIPDGKGHLDVVMFNNNHLHIVDLKYGKGIFIEAEKNKQLMIYALGALRYAELHSEIETITCTIYQPRLNNNSSYSISKQELLDWSSKELKPKAKLASEGKGSYKPGDHCQFCRAKNNCKALYNFNIELAKFEFSDVNKVTDEDISFILSKKDIFKNWLSSIEEYALHEAVANNKKWPGFKLVEGRSNRVIIDKEKAIQILKDAKLHTNLFLSKPELVGITALEKNVGTTRVHELLSDIIHKPPGSPTLVDENDKRSELNANDQAKKVFNNNLKSIRVNGKC